jgi:hypothetical protein
MQSLFDSIEDIKLPEQKPRRSTKRLWKVLGIVAAVIVLSVGGYFGYREIFPLRLTERALPATPEQLLQELKAARDGIDSGTRDIYGRIQQFNQKMEALGRKPVSFSQVFLQGLSAEEEAALDKMVKDEKDPSYRGVLAQVVEDFKKIRNIEAKVSDLESRLPGEGTEAKAGDTHMKLAKEYLVKERGIPEPRAKELIVRLNIMEVSLEKGNRVHFYYDPAKDFFGTWVSQGSAKRSPLALIRAKEMRLIGERDVAIAKATTLEEKKAELEGVLAKLEEDVVALEKRKALLESNVAQLETDKNMAIDQAKVATADLKTEKNSMFYAADLEANLKAKGVLKIFNRVEQIGDVKFDSNLDLSQSKSITFKPSQFGIDRIRDLRVIPAFFKEGRDLDVKFEDNGAVVTVLNEAALKGQRVLFVVTR